MVEYWAAEGMTSYKAYMNITREELGVAIQQAHAHKLKLTGHLCSVTWPEAIALGIDDLSMVRCLRTPNSSQTRSPTFAHRWWQQQLGQTDVNGATGAGNDPQSRIT